jgi:PIN domain nuclease of toxin-antitoxin system
MTTVLDSSALLALLWNEPGSEAVAAVLDGGLMSTVNAAEVYSKIIDRGLGAALAESIFATLPIQLVVFDAPQAKEAGLMRDRTRHLGLSIGDRACLALAKYKGADAITADSAWTKLEIGISISSIR